MDLKNVIYLIGRPGSGKYTVAKELQKHNYVLCDNHLINNPIFSLLDLANIIPEHAWSAVDKIRSAVFDFIKTELNSDNFNKNGFVFTNVLYEGQEYDAMVYEKIQEIAEGHNFIPVKLTLSPEENLKRIKSIERVKMHKSVNPDSLELDKNLINISHPNLLELDVTNMPAKDAAAKILQSLKT